MGKHIDEETKYNYIIGYLNGKGATKLGLEINNISISVKKIGEK